MNPPAGTNRRDPQEILNRHKERAKDRLRKDRQEQSQGRPSRQPSQQQLPARER